MTRADLIDLHRMLSSLGAFHEVRRFQGDPLAWLLCRCRTFDPEAAPGERTALLLPGDASQIALAHAWSTGLSYDDPKSRRTTTTWTQAGLFEHEALFVGGTSNFVISETDAKSRDIIFRIKYMLDHMDDGADVPIRHLWEIETYVDQLHFRRFCGKPWDARITGLPQGETAIRQYGGSTIWIDEAGVQFRFKKLVQAVAPAARRLICTGTLERNLSYSERCSADHLRLFDGPELAGTQVSSLRDYVSAKVGEDRKVRVSVRLQPPAEGQPEGCRPEAAATRRAAWTPIETELGPIERLARGVHRWVVRGRWVYRIHFRSVDRKDTDQYTSDVAARMDASLQSPEWLTEMEIDPDAFTGEVVYPEWDETRHVATVEPEKGGNWWQVGMVDFGSTNPSAMLFGSWNGHWLRIWGEHYCKGRPAEWHRMQCRELIASRLGVKAEDDEFFRTHLKLTLVDPSGAGYIMQYQQPPVPWPMTVEILGKRLNDPRAGESAVKTLLDDNGVCCGRVLYVPTCPTCGDKIEQEPGILVDRSCVNLRRQMKTLRRPEAREGLETPERPLKVEDHATDALKYGARGLVLLLRAPLASKPAKKETDSDGRRVFHMPSGRSNRSGLERAYSE